MALFGEAYRSFFRQTSCFLDASRVAARRTRNVSRPQSSRCTRLCFTLSVFAMSREYIKIHRDFALRNFFLQSANIPLPRQYHWFSRW